MFGLDKILPAAAKVCTKNMQSLRVFRVLYYVSGVSIKMLGGGGLKDSSSKTNTY